MHPTPRLRRLWLVCGVLAAIAVLGWLGRGALTRLAVTKVLQLAGASAIKFDVVEASPWRVELARLDFQVRTQSFAAGHLVIERAHWWMLSLGRVTVTDARVPVNIDDSDVNPWAWATYQNGTAKVEPLALPLEELAVDGQLVVQAAALADQPVTVQVRAQRTSRTAWNGRVTATGPGLTFKAEGTADAATKELVFAVTEAALDLAPWQNFLQRLVLLPGGAWELAGHADGHAAGRWRGKEFAATATVRLRDGHAGNVARAITADGVSVDLEFTDLDNFRTKPGALRIRELHTGRLELRDFAAEVAFDGAKKIVVTAASLQTLGGSVTAEPFKYFPDLRELEVVVRVDGIDMAAVMALTRDLPAQATGQVNGRFPLRLDDGGLRLGTGWMELKPGVAASIQFNARGLLTNGVAANSPSYAVLQKLEAGLLKLRITELRLDIRPPNAVPGRSATLHLAGEPLDLTVKAPIILDLNVNGPLEKLLNMGLDSRLNFGAGK